MMTEICAYLKNYFDNGMEKAYGTFHIENGVLAEGAGLGIQNGQYYRLIGSAFNSGVWKYGEDVLTDEEPFSGAVWLMAVPPVVSELSAKIDEWQAKYGGIDSAAMSPFISESFAGYYSYSKGGSGSDGDGSGGAGTWQSIFGPALRRWKKL